MSCNAKKDPNGTWRIQYRWTDWTGTKKKSQKRGFKTKKEAEEWYAHFMVQQSSDPTMTLAYFWEIYKADMLDCNYSRKYVEYVRCVDEYFGERTEYEIHKYVEKNMKNWKSDLERAEKI